MYKLAIILLVSVLGHLKYIDTISIETIDDRCEPGGPHTILEPLSSPVAFLKEGKHLVYKANKESSLVLRCCAREPIKWTYDFNELRRPWETIAVKIVRYAPDPFNQQTYDFYIEEEISFLGTEAQAESHINTTFDCQGIESRTVSRVDIKKVNQRIDIIAHNSLIQLPLTSPPNEVLMLNHIKENCPFYIHIRASSSGVLDLMCIIKDKPVRPYVFEIRDFMSWENSYRSTKLFGEKCILPFADTEKCGVGKRCQRYERKLTYNPLVIMCKHGTERRVLKGFFDIDKGSNNNVTFYFNFKDVKPESMIALLEPRNQSDFYHLSTVQFTVKVNQFYFANFTKISMMEVDSFATEASTVREYPIDPTIYITENCLLLTFNYTFQNFDVDVMLHVRAPIWNSREWASLSKDIFIEESRRPSSPIMKVGSDFNNYYTNTDEFGRVTYIIQANSDFELMCNSSGIPAPKISLVFPRQDITIFVKQFTTTKNGSTILIVKFTKIATFVSGLYEFTTSNFRGSKSLFFMIEVVSNAGHISKYIIIPSILFVVFVIPMIVFGIVKVRQTKRHRQLVNTNTTIASFPLDLQPVSKLPPLDKKFIIHKECVTLDKSCKLGEGEFGAVYKGTLKLCDDFPCLSNNSDSDSVTVEIAVKVLKECVSQAHRDAVIREMNVLANVGDHCNIIQFYGALAENYENGQLSILIEFCQKGSLLELLRESGQKVRNALCNEDDLNYAIEGAYVHRDLVAFSSQLACGMEYLEKKKIVHGDLATRNVLVNEAGILKISDFGLSKQLVNYDIYMKSSQCPLPFRWMSPEALKMRCFSIKSDVWSFGVTCWEIFSYGSIPYPGLTWTTEFVDLLESGGIRLPKPRFASDYIYRVIVSCLEVNADKRPSFEDLRTAIQTIWTTFG